MKRVIVIDPGHGGNDPGAMGSTGVEKAITLAVGTTLQSMLDVTFPFIPYLTRSEDRFIALAERVRIARELHADFFLSLHCNAWHTAEPHGIQVYYYHPAHKHVAEIMYKQLKRVKEPTKWSSVREGNYKVLRDAEWPAVLVEMGFITNPQEEQWLLDADNQIRLASSLMNGLVDWYFDEIERRVKV